jgi:hypothetical protein
MYSEETMQNSQWNALRKTSVIIPHIKYFTNPITNNSLKNIPIPGGVCIQVNG